MKIELSAKQQQEVQNGRIVEVVDPDTKHRYVLLAPEQYERVRHIIETPPQPSEAATGIPPGIRRSQEAFWRDLPDLLKKKSNREKWVCYHHDERIGIARTEMELIRECRKRGIQEEDYYTDVILPYDHAPWEPEEIEMSPEFEDHPSPNSAEFTW